jgi:hypothetical protein
MNVDCEVCLEHFLVVVVQFSASPIPKFHFYHFFYLSFNDVFQKAVLPQDVTKPVSIPSLYYM